MEWLGSTSEVWLEGWGRSVGGGGGCRGAAGRAWESRVPGRCGLPDGVRRTVWLEWLGGAGEVWLEGWGHTVGVRLRWIKARTSSCRDGGDCGDGGGCGDVDVCGGGGGCGDVDVCGGGGGCGDGRGWGC
eukprot:362046-Chlamydomonas_euryale.AAC.2